MYLPPRLTRFSIRFYFENKSVYYNRAIDTFIEKDDMEAAKVFMIGQGSKVIWDRFVCKWHDGGIDEYQSYLDGQ